MDGPWSYFGKGFDVCMQLFWGSNYFLGKGHRFGLDNRYTSCDLLIHAKTFSTNIFGIVRKNSKYIPTDVNEMYSEAKDYQPGEYQTRYSEKAGLIFAVVKSNTVVRVMSNCHSSTAETDLDRFVAEDDSPELFTEAAGGRRKIQTAQVLEDYSLTMNFTDCGAGLGGRLTKYHWHSVRPSQPFLDFISFEIAPTSSFVL